MLFLTKKQQAKKRSLASTRGIKAQYDIHSEVGLSYTYLFPAQHAHFAELYFSYIIHKYGIIGLDLGMNTLRSYYNADIAQYYDKPYETGTGIIGGPHAGVQLPCRIGKATFITPRLVYHYGIGAMDGLQQFHNVRAGAQMSFGKNYLFTLGIFYQFTHTTNLLYTKPDLHGIGVQLCAGI